MKLDKYSDKDILGLIDEMQNGIAIKPNSEESETLKLNISRAYVELERRAQKKRETELSGKTGQLPQNPELEYWAKKVQQEGKVEKPKKQEIIRELSGSYPGVIREIAPVIAPQPSQSEIVVSIWLNRKIDGKIKQVQEDFTPRKLQDYIQTYFVRLRDSEALRAGNTEKIHRGLMFPNLIGCVLGLIECRGSFPESVILTGRKKMNKEEFARAAILMSLIRYSIEK